MLMPNLVWADTVNILGLFPFSGPYADSGKLTDQGARIALEEINYTINGKKIKYVTRDSETKAGPAARRAQEAIDTEGVKFIIGPWSSGVALAVTEVAKKNKVKGKHLTPFLLQSITSLTEGETLKSNIKLMFNNAKLAAKIAISFNEII